VSRLRTIGKILPLTLRETKPEELGENYIEKFHNLYLSKY
jgi:hypothetical protein